MTARTELVQRLAAVVGQNVFQIEDVQSGWPALVSLHVDGSSVPLALFAGQLGTSHRNRDDVERRFQNPGKTHPLLSVPGRASVLVGLWEEDKHVSVPRPIVVTADAARREGRRTRWPAFAPLATLNEALATGWATHISDSGELIRCLVPSLLPAAIVADLAGVEPDEQQIRIAVEASGLLDVADSSPNEPAAARARRAATSLVRDARFARRVLDAYGQRCAMCGLGLSLVQGAHIYPASAPGSVDEPWNGLALCANHHVAFDRHMIAVVPSSMKITFRADVLDEADSNPTTAAFVEGTLPALAPAAPGAAPRDDMLVRRYEHFADSYAWVPAGW